jgi:tellurite resistance protein TerC
LSKGLSFILAFIGFKMFIEAFHGVGIHEIAGLKLPHVPIEISLFVIVAALTVTAVASLTATLLITLGIQLVFVQWLKVALPLPVFP